MQNRQFRLMPESKTYRYAPCWILVSLLLSMAILILEVHAKASGTSDDYPKVFRFGVLNVLAKVNQKDAQVAVEMNFVKQNQKQFPGIKARLEILTDVNNAALMFHQNQLHGISLTGIDYLALRELVPIVPLFISSRQDKPLEAYVLLTQKSVQSVDDLSHQPRRHLVMENLGEKHVGQVWLDNFLWEKGLGESKGFFTAIRKADKPARMVLPVFFGQADACLVPESAYRAMVELNPQIERRLHILARSPGLIKTIHCATDLMPNHMVERFKIKGANMENTVDGRQLLLIFHVKKNFIFQPHYIIDSERIFREYEQLAVSNRQ